MKMAKASEADLKAALEVCSILHGLERGHMPAQDDDDDYEPFDIDDREQCQRALKALLDAVDRGSISRVILGMAVVLDPKNKIVDPDAETLELHPEIAQALEAASAKEASDA